MQNITLITDWHKSDYYLGALKGTIISRCEASMNLVDINHHIEQYQYKEAAFVLRNSYHYYPKGTIHVNTINNQNTYPVPYIAVSFDDHFFVSPNSGTMNLITQGKNYKAVMITAEDFDAPTFPELHYISKAICHITQMHTIDGLGEPYTLREINYLRPQYVNNELIGTIIHIDGYGNIITNITEKTFNEVRQNRNFSILLKGKHEGLEKIYKGYEESINELIATFNSTSLLEIAQMNFPAYKSLGLRLGDRIKITFK
ncbi:MAG: SAM-dependent chlorinase/fluorinase [Salinivirgaceae bacterium]|jgi:S-adenosylmethionine hydrolase|nr:SAM-dependent chlorinase/fluorinase [Salinivirgaceae bacterium]